MTIVYKVIMNVGSASSILGKGQLGEFATQEVADNIKAFEKDLSLYYEPKQVKTIEKLVKQVGIGKTITNTQNAKLLLNVLGYRVIDIKVY